MIGNQELYIEGGVNVNSLPGLRDVQSVSRGSNFLEHLEGTIVKVFRFLLITRNIDDFELLESHQKVFSKVIIFKFLNAFNINLNIFVLQRGYSIWLFNGIFCVLHIPDI